MKLLIWQKTNRVSNRQLARMVKVHESLLCHINAGRRKTTPHIALRIEQATGGQVTRDELLFPELYQDKPVQTDSPI